MSFLTSTAVFIAEGDTVARESYGRWHSPQTPVAWASVSKLLTGAAVRGLIEQGALDDDTPVRDVFGVGPGSITIRGLIEHQSGLARVLPEQEKNWVSPYAGWSSEMFDQQVVSRLSDLLRPGAGYSNLGYAVLARVIERVTQLPLLDAVRRLVFTPLDIDEGSLTTTDDNSAVAYSRSLTGAPLHDWNLSGPWIGAGGFATTLATLATIITRGTTPGNLFDPHRKPHPWAGEEPRYFHNGALLRCGSLAVVDVSSGRVAIAHALGGPTGIGNVLAESALKSAVRRAQR